MGFIVQHAAMNLFLIFQYGLIGLLVVLVTLFSSVMFCETCTEWVGERLGLYTKNNILTFLGIGMGGTLLALQALMSYKRAKALEDTANAQAEAAKAQAKATEEQAKANQNTEQGQRQERLKNAIEHLGHGNASVRLGGAYELFHLAEDTAEDTKDLRQTVLDILCAHIRRTTGENKYRKKYPSKPSEEIQSLLTLLFVQDHEVFKGLHINLQESWLNGADLQKARLDKAVLTRTYLQKAILTEAALRRAYCQETRLSDAHLDKARLQGVRLDKACLQRTRLWETRLQGANLLGARLQMAGLDQAQLQGAYLWGAYLQGSHLDKACMQGSRLGTAQLQGASLEETCLQGAVLWNTQLQGASLWRAQLQGVSSVFGTGSSSLSFEDHMRQRCGEETDLSEVTFAGGLVRHPHEEARISSQTHRVLSKLNPPIDLVVKGLSDEKEKELREKLESHIDQPASHELPKNSGADTGAYTAEEAEQWIAEYNEAMSEVPKESDN